MFNCLSCTLTPSDKVKRNLLKMRTASLWCYNHHAMVKWFLHPRVNMMERSSTTQHSSLTPSLCFLAQVAPFSPLGTQNAIFSFFPPCFDFSCAGDALDFYFCSFACDAPCSCSYSSSCPYLCSCSSSSRPGLLSPSSSPPRPSSRCSSPRWTPTSYSHVWQAFGHPWCLEAQPTSP